jgi:hypothetical protein
MANRLDPSSIWDLFEAGVKLDELLKPEEDALDHQTEQFRKEVLDDLDYRGVKYQDGILVLTDIHNSDTRSTGVRTALINSIR